MEIRIVTLNHTQIVIPANMTKNLWKFPAFPQCYPIAFTDLNNLTMSVAKPHNISSDKPEQIWFYINKIKNFGVSVKLEERNRSLKKRQLKANLISYVGPSIENMNLKHPKYFSVMIR